MDIKTLEALGISAEALGDRIVDQAVETLLHSTGFNPETEEETSYKSQFKREIEERLQKAVDAKIAALAEEHLIPRVGELIRNANLRQTSKFGEPKGEPMTFLEYITSRAAVYMSEDVDSNGKAKHEASDSYNWRSAGPRLTVLMRMYIRETLEAHAKKAVADVNSVIAQNITKAAQEAIARAAAAMKVSVTA